MPTGYGKTYGLALAYGLRQRQGRANRLLVIVPSDAQRNQFVEDGPAELADAGVAGPLAVIDVSYFGVEALKRHRRNTAQVFVITIQALRESRGADHARDLMESGKWMVAVDEYHHYGVDRSWGRIALALPAEFLLALSATPGRPQNDSAFGLPDVSVSYREARDEGAVKSLRAHSYRYQVDALDKDGNLISFTTAELVDAAGGDDPERIESLRIRRQMRWSPKYISPLISIPIERLQRDSLASGYRLQALVTAMCVSHAHLVCEQISAMFPELRVDWVGTGTNGRTAQENKAILAKFCPPKDQDGRRSPTLDVLVNVGMAGEGLDSINVSEVVFLTNASVCNRNNQIIGRASRFLPAVVGNVNFDGCSEYAERGYIGSAIMDALDDEPPSEDQDDDDDRDIGDGDWDGQWEPLPEQPAIKLFNLKLIGIDSGDAEVQRMAKVLQQQDVKGIPYTQLVADKDHPAWRDVIELYHTLRALEAEAHHAKAVTEQWRDAVAQALTGVTGLVIRIMSTSNGRVDKSLAGDIKKRINSRKYMACGPVAPDVEICKKHYQWLRNLESEMLQTGIIPLWLR